METNPLISVFATAFLIALATPGCAASLEPTRPHVPADYVLAPPAPTDETAATAGVGPRPALPAVIHARAFGESGDPSAPIRVAQVPFLAPDTSHAGAEPCRLVAIPEGTPAPSPRTGHAGDDQTRSGALASGSAGAAKSRGVSGAQPPTVTVTGFRSRAPVDVAWAFPVPPSRDGGPRPAAPTGKTLVQMALFDAMPSPDAKPRTVLQCTSEIDSIAWAVPRAIVDELLGSAPPPGAVVRVSVARAPGKLPETAKPRAGSPLAVGAYVDLPVEANGALSRR